jgi:hypothetical protein
MATLGANIAPFLQDLSSAKGHAKKEGEGIGSALGGELAGKLKGLVALGAIEETIRRTAEYASRVQDISNRLGISTTAVQEWDFALKQNGSSIDAATGFFEKLAVSRDKALKGNPELIEHYRKLGVSIAMLKTGRTEDIAKTTAKTYETGDPQQLIASLKAVGGKAAGELAAAFRDGLAGLLDEAPLISPEDIASIDRATDAFGRMKAEITSGLAPALAAAAEAAEGLFHKLDAAAGVGMALLVGTFRELQNLWQNGKIDFGSIKKEAMQMLLDKAMEDVERRDAAKAKADRLAKGNRGGGGADQDGADADYMAKADTIAQEQLDLAEKEAARDADTAAKKAERIEEAEAKRERNRKDEMAFKSRDQEINSLQRIGGFLGSYAAAPELAMLDVQKKSESHLAEIKKVLIRQQTTRVSDGGTGVVFD